MQVLNRDTGDSERGRTLRSTGRANVDAQRKMNEEITALFKAEGVNPAGGCLPILLQLPILGAFYNLLSTAIELRDAPWFGWVHDLSIADPYYVLPILMGVTQVIQQRMTPQTGIRSSGGCSN
jgi:YidC/Oxa1 family membrane protein insertase